MPEPALTPAIGAAAAVVFLFCATSFGVVLVLGGARYRTLETEIYRQTADLFDLPVAAVLALLQLVAVSAVLVVHDRLDRRRGARAVALRNPARRRPHGRAEAMWVAGNLALIAGARGGVYLAGGILPRWGARFDGAAFRRGFEDKPPYTAWLRAIPSYLVMHPQPGLLGLAVLAEAAA